jgi:cyanoexosortase B-associated protein
LMLMPQNYYKNHPNVEWVDLQGIEKWKTDSHKTLKFAAAEGSQQQVKARFFRAWNKQTVAVMQWYAWPQGGHYASGHWFWADQMAQLKRQRVPWIAVSLKIPIEPLSDVKEIEALTLSLAQNIQNTLNREIFQQ